MQTDISDYRNLNGYAATRCQSMDRKPTRADSRRSRRARGRCTSRFRSHADLEHELAASHSAKRIDQALGIDAYIGQTNQAQQTQAQASTGTGCRTSAKASCSASRTCAIAATTTGHAIANRSLATAPGGSGCSCSQTNGADNATTGQHGHSATRAVGHSASNRGRTGAKARD